MTTPSDAGRAGERYDKVHVALSGSNVRTVGLWACRDCGVFVFNRWTHDEHHDAITTTPTDPEATL